jgi:hypothetical protein
MEKVKKIEIESCKIEMRMQICSKNPKNDKKTEKLVDKTRKIKVKKRDYY